MTVKQRAGQWIYAHAPVSRRVLNILRFELQATRQRCANATFPWRRLRILRLKRLRGVSVNVGSGGRGHAGWINLDAAPNHADIYCTHDLRRPLPFANESVRRLLAEHVVEHLDYRNDVPRVFAEFFRVLEKGGVARIIVPDTERFLRAYLAGSAVAWAELGFPEGRLPADMATPMAMINHVFHQDGEHCFGWDFATLNLALRRAGFTQVVRQHYGRCVDQLLAIDQPKHAAYSLYVDAIKD